MQNNNSNDYPQDDEIDFKEIFKLLINSKKLIIAITLVITTLGAIYSFQQETEYKSTALIEIGNYSQDQAGYKLIEPPKTLINELNIHFIHKHKENLSINSIENRIINISSTSVDPAKNTDLLNKVIQYTKNRHSLLLSKRTQKAENILTNEKEKPEINSKNLSDYLGVKKFKYDVIELDNKVGVATGLAWTEFGGEILKIESAMMPGKGKMQITGKLGDVMQESVKAAKSYVRSKSLEFGIIPPIFEKKDFHVHVPDGATPKDGPSAGIAMVTSIVSSITGVPVDKNIAMTGEVTLRGQVLPIGGLKEKLLAAHRGRIPKVLIPEDNKKDLAEIPKNILENIEIITVKNVDEVLKIALTKELKPIEWIEVESLPKSKGSEKSATIPH